MATAFKCCSWYDKQRSRLKDDCPLETKYVCPLGKAPQMSAYHWVRSHRNVPINDAFLPVNCSHNHLEIISCQYTNGHEEPNPMVGL